MAPSWRPCPYTVPYLKYKKGVLNAVCMCVRVCKARQKPCRVGVPHLYGHALILYEQGNPGGGLDRERVGRPCSSLVFLGEGDFETLKLQYLNSLPSQKKLSEGNFIILLSIFIYQSQFFFLQNQTYLFNLRSECLLLINSDVL